MSMDCGYIYVSKDLSMHTYTCTSIDHVVCFIRGPINNSDLNFDLNMPNITARNTIKG